MQIRSKICIETEPDMDKMKKYWISVSDKFDYLEDQLKHHNIVVDGLKESESEMTWIWN